MKKHFLLIIILIIMLLFIITSVVALNPLDDNGFREVMQRYDGKITYQIIKPWSPGNEKQYVAGYIITDADGTVLLKSDNLAYISDNGDFVEIIYDRDESGSLKYSGSRIIREGKEDIVVPTVGLYPFGNNFIGTLHLSNEVVGIYDYEGKLIFDASEYKRVIAIDNLLYVVKDNFTQLMDSDFNILGQANFEISKRMSQDMYINIKGLNDISNENSEKLGLIFEEGGLSGICDLNLNILLEAQSLNIIYHSNKLFELSDDTELYLYKDGNSIKTIKNFSPVVELTRMKPFSIKIGSSEVHSDQGISYIDKDNLDVVPVLENNRTLVPIRFIDEKVPNLTVEWDGEQNRATFLRPGVRLSIVIGNDIAILNKTNSENMPTGEINYNMNIPARIINGRTFVPLRAIGELLGVLVNYDEATNMITIGG